MLLYVEQLLLYFIIRSDLFSQKEEALGQCAKVYPEEGYVRRGLYAYQLEHWLRFFPPSQLMVINHEEVR